MDIIFFAAVAFYIFFKLFKQFGRIDEEEKKQIEEKLALKRKEILAMQSQVMKQLQQKAIPLSSAENPSQNQAEKSILDSLDESTKQNFLKILQSANITAEFFVNGAKSAFEMVLKAFAKGDLESLKFLLSEKISQGFTAAINQRQAQEKILTTNLISIEKTEIISALIIDNFASIAVKFISQQINYISDKNGQIIEGRKDEITQLTDIWTFKKEITSPDPNWVVCATSNI